VIASADYSQIELRIMAHLSGDEACCTPFRTGWTCTAPPPPRCLAWRWTSVSSEQRRYAKVINFGLIYGMSSFGLAKQPGHRQPRRPPPTSTATFSATPASSATWTRPSVGQGQGYVETVFGRRLYLPEINSPNGPRRAGAERAAINAPMQGTAADLIKLAMVAVQARAGRAQAATRMIMQVHDELVFEVPEADVDWVKLRDPPPDGRRGRAQGAAAGRSGRGAELGQGALMCSCVQTATASQSTKHARTSAHATPQAPRRRRIHKGGEPHGPLLRSASGNATSRRYGTRTVLFPRPSAAMARMDV
jgi:hypothetical protein